jgi:hypothetical protein
MNPAAGRCQPGGPGGLRRGRAVAVRVLARGRMVVSPRITATGVGMRDFGWGLGVSYFRYRPVDFTRSVRRRSARTKRSRLKGEL